MFCHYLFILIELKDINYITNIIGNLISDVKKINVLLTGCEKSVQIGLKIIKFHIHLLFLRIKISI